MSLRTGEASGIETLLTDENREHVAAIDRAFEAGEMRKEHLGPIPSTRLQQLTSIAFGANPKDVYLGTLHADCVYRVRIDD